MRTTLKTDFGTIIGENINDICIRVSIENRKDLGSVLLYKKTEDLVEGELLAAGKALSDKEIVEEYGTFILDGTNLWLKDRDDLGAYPVEDTQNVKKNLYSIYSQFWEPTLKRELAKAAKEEAKKESKKSTGLF
jgi:hypothetical protein